MLEKYKNIFNIYLKVCKDKYDPNNPYDNLADCIETCERFKWRLSGMLELMRELGEITKEIEEMEWGKVLNTFSSIDLFNAYINNGEVMVFRK